MSGIEQLKEKIASVRQGIADEKTAEEEAKIHAAEERRRELEKEAKMDKLVEENWQIARKTALEFFQEINREILNGRGKITEGKQDLRIHHHSYEYWQGLDIGMCRGFFMTRCSTDAVELYTPDFGPITFFRPVKYEEAGEETRIWREKLTTERMVFIGRGAEEPLCPTCNDENFSKVLLWDSPIEVTDQTREGISTTLAALIYKAEKVQQEAVEAQPRVPQKGFLNKLFGK